jgi:hypothetical protein
MRAKALLLGSEMSSIIHLVYNRAKQFLWVKWANAVSCFANVHIPLFLCFKTNDEEMRTHSQVDFPIWLRRLQEITPSILKTIASYLRKQVVGYSKFLVDTVLLKC